jgi:hypothetical protein
MPALSPRRNLVGLILSTVRMPEGWMFFLLTFKLPLEFGQDSSITNIYSAPSCPAVHFFHSLSHPLSLLVQVCSSFYHLLFLHLRTELFV